MSEILHSLGLICATALGAAAVTFGLRAGIEAAHWAFGPFTINIKRGDLNIVVRSDAASSEEKK